MQGDHMTEAATKQIDQVVDGKFRLGQLVGRTERSAVFLTDYAGQPVKKAAIKLIPADSVDAPAQLARWKHAAKLSHPHLVRILEMGRCELDHIDMLYVVMEYAEENLSLVIKRRPLTPEEARDLLSPVVDALAYVHAQGFVHCRLKPSNIMADDDLLKISSDGLCRIGESGGSPGKPGAYDPPEAAGGRISPAGDVWSLGMTLTESLTQRLPVWERTNQAEPSLPSNLQPEILDLARHCLRRDPQMRWTVADIAARLQPNSSAPPKQIPLNPQPSFANPRAIGGVVLAGVALAAILGGLFLGPRLFKRPSQTQPVPAATPELAVNQTNNQAAGHVQSQPPTQLPSQPSIQPPAQSNVQPAAPSVAQPESENKPALSTEPALSAKSPSPAQTAPQQPAPPSRQQASLIAKSSPQPASQQHAAQPPAPQLAANSTARSPKNSAENKPAPNASALSSAHAESPTTTSTSGVVRGKVVQQILPDAPQKARDTIRGKVRLSVKVNVDESGAVTQATLDAPGPSQYFADRTLAAAKLWKFAPAKLDGRNVPSQWLLYFEIDPATTTVHPKETTP
jgi:eukaryotic-like serine/threonine-protein kinase